MKKSSLFLLFSALFILVVFTSIGYSAFSTNLNISGDGIVISDSNLRITELKKLESVGGAYETYNSRFTAFMTEMNVKLPNSGSSITYQVTITNKTSSYFSPNAIEEMVNSNSNISYSIIGLESYGLYQGNPYTFKIKFTTTGTNQEKKLTLKFNLGFVSQTVYNFGYTGSEQKFSVPYNAKYKLEVWGAQGGSSDSIGGKGGYSYGEVNLINGSTKFIYVGGVGSSSKNGISYGGFNGGGNGMCYNNAYHGTSGGGATHIATKSGLLSTLSSDSILIVAGGGGGAGTNRYGESNVGGAGGGLNGINGVGRYSPGTGGTQSIGGNSYNNNGVNSNSGSSFGRGSSITGTNNNEGSGGGGGYWGGGSGGTSASAGGGSGFISSTLTSSQTIAGNQTFISPSGASETGHTGAGYARISLIPLN